MTKKLVFRLAIALIPFGMGVGGYFVFHLVYPQVPLLVFKADFGSTVAVVGATLSLVLLSWVLGWAIEIKRGEQVLSEERMQQEISRRRFIRRLDHELKNPLTGLRAALVNLKSLISGELIHLPGANGSEITLDLGGENKPGKLWPEASRTIMDAQYQIERLSRLVADLRKLAELEERPLETSQVNLADLLADTVEAICSLPAYTNRKI